MELLLAAPHTGQKACNGTMPDTLLHWGFVSFNALRSFRSGFYSTSAAKRFFLLLFFLGFFFLTCFYPTNPNNIQLFAEHTGHQLWKCEAASRRDWISEHRRNPNTKNDPRATVINWQRLVTVIIKIQRLFIQKKPKKHTICRPIWSHPRTQESQRESETMAKEKRRGKAT